MKPSRALRRASNAHAIVISRFSKGLQTISRPFLATALPHLRSPGTCRPRTEPCANSSVPSEFGEPTSSVASSPKRQRAVGRAALTEWGGPDYTAVGGGGSSAAPALAMGLKMRMAARMSSTMGASQLAPAQSIEGNGLSRKKT